MVKRYGEIVAVDGVDLAVTRGEVYALVGANGAGKSTLIRMITGITQPDSGKILIGGHDMALRSTDAKRLLGYLPEDLILYDRLTGREYLELVAGLREARSPNLDEEISFFELSEVQDKWVGGYSLGMRKKLGLAAAMIGQPELLVLDEPLNGLDVEMMRKLRLRLESERDCGRAVLVSSHVMSFVERVCTRAGIMREGKIVAEGSPCELRLAAGLEGAPFEDVFFQLAK